MGVGKLTLFKRGLLTRSARSVFLYLKHPFFLFLDTPSTLCGINYPVLSQKLRNGEFQKLRNGEFAELLQSIFF